MSKAKKHIESLAQEKTETVLLAVSMGRITIMEAASLLDLPDAGEIFHLMAKNRFRLPKLPNHIVSTQLNDARDALDDCLLKPEKATKRHLDKDKK